MPKLFHDSAVVPLDSFYVERSVDSEYIARLRAGVEDDASGPHLHGSRQSGKSSLAIRAKAALNHDFVVVLVDLQARFAVAQVHPGTEALSLEGFWNQFFENGIARELEKTASESPLRADAIRLLHDAGGVDPVNTLTKLIDVLDKPLVLLIDEFDRLGDMYRGEVCRVLRALCQERGVNPALRFNVSLIGVLPPTRTDDSPAVHAGIEPVGGDPPIWLDDIPVTDEAAEQLRARFATRKATRGFRVEDGREILRYTGGYPQAIAWVGNLLAEAAEIPGGVRFDDQSFGERMRELASPVLRRDARNPDDRRRDENSTAWLDVLADYFMGHTDVRHLNATAEALKLYEQVLELDADPAAERITYRPYEEAHQTLRFSGFARRDNDGKLRVRAPLFREVFGPAWIGRMRTEVYERQMGAHARGHKPLRPGKSRYASDKRLLILATGGTIGMLETTEGSIGLGEDLLPEWAFEVKDLLGSLPTVVPMFGLDGADMGPVHWSKIGKQILLNQEDFDGVVVTHGTDTLAYTASAVAFALGRDLGFPVVFTGSQTTTDVLHGDSISNILRACLVASQDLPEVVVCFGEKIFRATRTQKKDDLRFDAFESPGYPELGFVAEEVQIFRQSILPKPATNAALSRRSTEFASGILLVSQMPGSEAAFYQAALRAVQASDGDPASLCRGIIIQSLGAGNIPTKDPAFSLRPLIEEADERSIPVILTSQYPVLPANYLRYSPSAAAIEAGAIPTGNMTISAVVAKLSWVLPQVDADIEGGTLKLEGRLQRIKAMMGEELVGEGGFTVFAETDSADETSEDAA